MEPSFIFRDPNMGNMISASNLTMWPSYDTASQKYIRLRGNLSSFPVESHFAASRIQFWNSFLPAISDECSTCPTCGQGDVTS